MKTLVVVGTMFVSAVLSSGDASAATRHMYSSHGMHAAHGIRSMRQAAFQRRGRGNRRSASRWFHRSRRASIGAASASPLIVAPPSDASPSAQTGRASFYGGGRTASGARVGVATCAHRTLPFGTRVLVTNLVNARQAILTVNDRGPFVRGRIVDVSTAAAGLLGMLHSGTALVSLHVLGRG